MACRSGFRALQPAIAPATRQTALVAAITAGLRRPRNLLTGIRMALTVPEIIELDRGAASLFGSDNPLGLTVRAFSFAVEADVLVPEKAAVAPTWSVSRSFAR